MLNEAQERNFKRWPILGEWVWPNVYVGQSYENEIEYLKDWLQDRVEWLDDHVIFSASGMKSAPAPARGFALQQNYPNPFNTQTIIPFRLQKRASVVIQVFDISGRLVATLLDEQRAPGAFSVVWNGRDDFGLDAASGLYSVRLTADNFLETRKILLLR